MPKSTVYKLTWSMPNNSYEIYQHDRQQVLPIDPEQADERWQEWLASVPSFGFQGQHGTYTVRKERSKQGQDYWYAYARRSEKLHKQYLAKDGRLTIERLEDVASLFQQKEAMRAGDSHGFIHMQALAQRTASSSQVESLSEFILTTKMSAPRLPPGLIPRTSLFERLGEAFNYPLTLISASAGSGKSTLVNSWLQHMQTRHAWLSLEQGDDEPTRFWRSFFAALNTLQPSLCDLSLALLRSSQSTQMEMTLTPLLNNLAALKQEIMIVLDDYHFLTQKAIHDALGYLIERLPAHVHLLISTRVDPPLPLARLRLHGQMLELRTVDLRFSGEEINAFLAQNTTLQLTREEQDLLEKRVEGWVAGLQLVTLTFQRGNDPSAFIKLFTGNHRHIVDYLMQEVVDQLPLQTQEFLLQTAILERLRGELCEEVTGQAHGQEMLSWLEQANLFLIPLDDERHWYRYHHLFADMLRQRLLQEHREDVPLLHQRACNWYLRQHLPHQALNHAQATGNMHAIADIIERYGLEQVNTGEAELVIEWLALLPREQRIERIRLFLFDVWGGEARQRYEYMLQRLHEYLALHDLPDIKEVGVEAFTAHIQRHVHEQCPTEIYGPEHRSECIAEMLTLCGMLSLSGLLEVTPYEPKQVSLALTERALSLVQGKSHRGRLEQHLGMFYFMSGAVEKAQAVYEDALLASMEDSSTTWVPSIAFILANLLLQCGQIRKAERLMQQTLRWARASDLRLLSIMTSTSVLGDIYYEWNDLEKAHLYLQEAVETARRLQWPHLLVTILAKLARVHKAQGADEKAEHICQELEMLFSQQESGHIEMPFYSRTALAHLKIIFSLYADKEEIRRLLSVERAPSEYNDYALYINERPYFVWVRVQQALGNWEEALPVCKHLYDMYERLHCTSRLNALTRLEALEAQKQGETWRAMDLVSRVLSQCEAEGAMRTIVEDGEPMLQLLLRLRKARGKGEYAVQPQCSLAYLDTLILLLRRQGGPPQEREQRLIEPLSEREREVLALVAEGYSNREIAERLIIAVSTVKSHIKAICGKLSAGNRTQAIAHAHKFHLLDNA